MGAWKRIGGSKELTSPRPVNGTPCILLGSIFYGGVFHSPGSSMSLVGSSASHVPNLRPGWPPRLHVPTGRLVVLRKERVYHVQVRGPYGKSRLK